MITLKKYNSTTSSWEEESPKVSVGTIVASGTPSSSTFLRGDGSWATPAGDVTGPASSVTARIATFNGTTGKVIQDSGTLISGLAASTHTHGNITNAGAIGTTASLPIITTTSGLLTTGSFGTTAGTFAQGNDARLSDARTPLSHTHAATDITSGVLPTSRGGTGTVSNAVQGGVIYGASTSAYASTAAGTSNSSQYLLSNGTSAPTFTSIFYCRILTSGVSTSVSSTVAVSVFDIALPIGSYHFETLGTITKNGATSKAYQILFTCDNTTGYTRLQGDVVFSPNTAFTANTGNAMSGFNNTVVNVVSSNITTPTSGSYFQGTTNTSAISNMPYIVSGIIVLTSARNFRMHIRQTAASTADTVVVNAGSFMKITRIG